MVPQPGESIYMWMYRQGLKQKPLDEVIMDLVLNGHDIRAKDVRNYWNGWYRHNLYYGKGRTMMAPEQLIKPGPLRYRDYPKHPFLGKPEFLNCFVPCNADNKPMIKWGNGTMSLADAKAWPGCRHLAENMKGAQRIVIDVDGDHGGDLHLDIIRFFDRYRSLTCCHDKPDIVFDWYMEHEDHWCGDLYTAELPTSFHLTFGTDRVIPTMHFTKAHIDIIGNRCNSLRYFKNKKYNGLPPLMMSEEIWNEIMDFIEEMERR